MDNPIPANAIIIRFSMKTPFWPFTLSYGLFHDPELRIDFASLDHYIGYRMLRTIAHKNAVLMAPNAFIANQTLLRIIGNPDNHLPIDPTWYDVREEVVLRGVRLKFGQHTYLAERLVRTGNQPIVDNSRQGEEYLCYCDGKGANIHGKSMEVIRDELASANPTWKPTHSRKRR